MLLELIKKDGNGYKTKATNVAMCFCCGKNIVEYELRVNYTDGFRYIYICKGCLLKIKQEMSEMKVL